MGVPHIALIQVWILPLNYRSRSPSGKCARARGWGGGLCQKVAHPISKKGSPIHEWILP